MNLEEYSKKKEIQNLIEGKSFKEEEKEKKNILEDIVDRLPKPKVKPIKPVKPEIVNENTDEKDSIQDYKTKKEIKKLIEDSIRDVKKNTKTLIEEQNGIIVEQTNIDKSLIIDTVVKKLSKDPFFIARAKGEKGDKGDPGKDGKSSSTSFGPYTGGGFSRDQIDGFISQYLIDNPITVSTGTIEYQDFITTATDPSWQEGRVFYDSTNKTLAVYNEISAVTHQLGQEFHVRVANHTGSTIQNGQAVMILSANGVFPSIRLAQARIGYSHTIGLVTHDIPDGEDGLVTLVGSVGGLDTSQWPEGTSLYLSTSAGLLTDSPPTNPYSTVEMGHVINSDSTEGKFLVYIDEKPLLVENNVLYVSNEGNDSSAVNGTEIKPYKTVKYALDTITDNSIDKRYVIYLMPGVFPEINPIQLKEYISVKSLGGVNTTRVVATIPNEPLFLGINKSELSDFTMINSSGFCFEMNEANNMQLNDISCMDSEGWVKINNSATEINIDNLSTITTPIIGTPTINGIVVLQGKSRTRNINVTSITSAASLCVVSGATADIELVNFDCDSSYVDLGFCVADDAALDIKTFDIRNCSSAFCMETSAYTHLFNGYIKNSDLGINVEANSKAEIYGVACDDCTLDLNAASTSTVIGAGNTFRNDRMNIDGPDFTMAHISNTPGDEGFEIKGELHVGSPEQPKESIFGQGDSYVNGMFVYQGNVTSTTTDISTSAKSYDGSSFTWASNTTNQCLYFASNLKRSGNYLVHLGIKLSILTSAVGGNVAIEYYNKNTSSWKSVNYMVTDSSSPYYPYAKDINVSQGSYQIRYDNFELKGLRWGANDPLGDGEDRFWIRWRITSAFTQMPEFEQSKLHSNRLEINDDGWVEYYGRGRSIGTLPWDAGLLEAAAASPANQDLYLSDTLDVGRIENKFANGATDRMGFLSPLPLDCDTSTPIKLEWSVITDDNTAGNIDWVVRWGYSYNGYNVYGNTTAPTTASTQKEILLTSAAPTLQNTEQWYKTYMDISEMRSRRQGGWTDTIWVTIQRTVGDTHSGNVSLIAINALYTKWCDGGHVDQFTD